MRKIPALAILAVIAATFAAPAEAQPTRTWVAAMGTDAGTCPRGAPCKTFAFAHSVVAAGGEISVLDPGGYGTVIINKSVSIVSDGGSGEAGVATFFGNGITINAGPSDVVILRGLVIDGLNSATGGVQFTTGGALHIQNSLIKNVRGASGVGINFTPSGAADLMVTDTTVINNNAGERHRHSDQSDRRGSGAGDLQPRDRRAEQHRDQDRRLVEHGHDPYNPARQCRVHEQRKRRVDPLDGQRRGDDLHRQLVGQRRMRSSA